MSEHTHIRLEYKEKPTSRVWRKSSLSMYKQGIDNMKSTAKAIKAQEGWHDYRIVSFTP